MDILVNGTNVDFTLKTERTLGEVLGSVEQAVEENGQTVISVRIDGSDVPAEGLDAAFSRDIGSVSRIELDTLAREDILSMLRALGKELNESVPLLEEIPVHLLTGKDRTVMETIHAFSVRLESLYKLLPLLPLTGIAPERLTVDSVPLSSYPGELAPLLGELLSALERKDTVTVGDIAEYELAPRITGAANVLTSL